jgi:hypothetical protein
MKKVTYLFGAGASAEALSVVAKIPEALETFKDSVKGFQRSSRALDS